VPGRPRRRSATVMIVPPPPPAGPARVRARVVDDGALWDAHRRHGVCINPLDLGLVQTRNRIWLAPSTGPSQAEHRRPDSAAPMIFLTRR
jgi:hypothetical protein